MKKLVCLLLAAVTFAAAAAWTGIFAKSGISGDVNGDGSLDNKDVVTLFRFLSADNAGAADETFDFNKDGETDNKDVVALFRYLSSAEAGKTEETEEIPQDEKELVVIGPGAKSSDFRLVYDKKAETPLAAEANMLAVLIRLYSGVNLTVGGTSRVTEKEIILSSNERVQTAEMLKDLSDGEYAVRVLPGKNDGEGKLLIATTTYGSAYTCAKYIVETYYSKEKGLCIPYGLDVRGTEKKLILNESSLDKKMRDPFVLVEDGTYYAYATGWKCFKNVSGSLDGKWKKVEIEVTLANPDTDGGSHWAPEVHKYNGSYYMFTTYFNSVTEHRGCIILKSDSPEGPFVEITNGFITPSDWDSIDGTFYVDPDGQPWMVFVHEWTSMPGSVGAFAAAKLSDDLTQFISKPIQLFKATDPVWAVSGVTDGCFMHTTEDGELLMIWSDFDSFGYAVGVAKSSNGRLDGKWTQETTPLYSKCMTGVYDGGHGMIFTDTDGKTYMSFHSPNTATDDRVEKLTFLEIEEKNGTLVPVTAEKD